MLFDVVKLFSDIVHFTSSLVWINSLMFMVMNGCLLSFYNRILRETMHYNLTQNKLFVFLQDVDFAIRVCI